MISTVMKNENVWGRAQLPQPRCCPKCPFCLPRPEHCAELWGWGAGRDWECTGGRQVLLTSLWSFLGSLPMRCCGCLTCGSPKTSSWAPPMLPPTHLPSPSGWVPVCTPMDGECGYPCWQLASLCRKPVWLGKSTQTWAFQGIGKTNGRLSALGLALWEQTCRILRVLLWFHQCFLTLRASSALPVLLVRNPELYPSHPPPPTLCISHYCVLLWGQDLEC